MSRCRVPGISFLLSGFLFFLLPFVVFSQGTIRGTVSDAVTGESLPGRITWARTYIKGGQLWTDVGRGEVVKLPEDERDSWWNQTTREWPFMAADLGIGRDTLMAHYLSNHIAVAYGDIFDELVCLSGSLGMKVRVLSGT